MTREAQKDVRTTASDAGTAGHRAAPTPALNYARSGRPSRLGWLAAGAILIGVICFPLGVGVTGFLEKGLRPPPLSHGLAEWSGFLTFALGAASGLCLCIYGLLPRRWRRAKTGVRAAFLVAALLNAGVFAVAIRLLIRWKG